MTRFIKKETKFEWSEDCEKCFEELKSRLTTTLVHTMPSGSGGYVVYYDASGRGLGAVLMNWGKVVEYASWQLSLSHTKRITDSLSRIGGSGVRIENF